MWEIEKDDGTTARGNWVAAVSPRQGGAAKAEPKPEPKKPEPKKPEPKKPEPKKPEPKKADPKDAKAKDKPLTQAERRAEQRRAEAERRRLEAEIRAEEARVEALRKDTLNRMQDDGHDVSGAAAEFTTMVSYIVGVSKCLNDIQTHAQYINSMAGKF